MPLSSKNWEFGRGVIINAGRAHLLSVPVVESGSEPGGVTQVINWRPDQLSSFMIPWEAKTITYVPNPEPHVVIIGPQGDVFIGSPHGNSEELIDESSFGPNDRGVIRDSRFIGKNLYAVGMSRQVYRRECEKGAVNRGRWEHIDEGVLIEKAVPGVAGFCSVDGYGEDEIYAAGWRGEIWWYDGRRWNATDSPTNLKLERIVCAPNGHVYALGQSATLLKGRKDIWNQIEHDVTTREFWGSSWYNDLLWMCTDSGLYCLTEDDKVKPVDIGIDGTSTFRWLDSADGVIWSFGANHVIHSSEGRKWTQVIFD